MQLRFRTVIAVILWVWLIYLLTGCTALKRPEELAWQGIHVYDALQTGSVVGEPCYRESHPLTRPLITAHPDAGQVAAWAAGTAALHAGVSNYLLNNDHRRLYAIWQVVTIADTGRSIEHNYAIGIRVGAANTKLDSNDCGGLRPSVPRAVK